MKRIVLMTLAAGAVATAGIAYSIHSAESAGNRGDGYRGSHSGGGWGMHGGGHRGSHSGGGWGRHGGGHRAGWRGHRGRHGGMHKMMKRFDADGDGKLTQEEITNGRRAMITKHDADGDGKLTLAEFEKLWLEQRHRRMVRSFQRLDVDGDAGVTVEEFTEPFANIVERMDRNEDGVLDKSDRKRGRGWRHRRGSGEGRGGDTEQGDDNDD